MMQLDEIATHTVSVQGAPRLRRKQGVPSLGKPRP